MNALIISAALLVFAAVLALVSTIYVQGRTTRLARVVEIDEHLTKIDQALQVLQTQVSPLWARVQAQISADLHHPHPRYLEMDTLLERLEALTITAGERDRLKTLLVERSQDMHEDITDDQRKKAHLMIQVMDLVVTETADAVVAAEATASAEAVVAAVATVAAVSTASSPESSKVK